MAQIGKGADVIFAAAGNSGLGVFDAVEQAGRRTAGRAGSSIGVDSNQNGVKPGFVLTSMVKRVDNAVYDIIREVVGRTVRRRLPRLRPRERRRRLRRSTSSTATCSRRRRWPPPRRRKQKIIAGEITVTDAMAPVMLRAARHHQALRRRPRQRSPQHHHRRRDHPRASSARTAPASRRRCASPTASTPPTAARSWSTATVARIRSPHDAIALGIGMVHQHFMLMPPMTVAENIVLGAEPGSALALDLQAGGRAISGRCPTSSGWRSIRTRVGRDAVGRAAAARRAAQGAVPPRAAADSRRADGGADAAGGGGVLRHPAPHARRRARRSSSSRTSWRRCWRSPTTSR